MAIILEKSGDQHRINLEKGSSSFSGEIVINLDWSKGGFFKQMFGKPVDLDLGCFYFYNCICFSPLCNTFKYECVNNNPLNIVYASRINKDGFSRR